ncbi:MAG: ABC transporter permease [Bryobacterales bacterium]|nr:ABC transporter permease [Bryobacterales bacterium]
MTNLRRTRAMARKEFLHIFRDPRSLIMALAVPVIMLLLFGYALSLDVDRVPTLIYDASPSPESRELIASFRGSRFFNVVDVVSSYAPIETAIDKGNILIAVVIPTDFSRRILRGEAGEIQVLVDGSDSNTASLAIAYVQGAIAGYGARIQALYADAHGSGPLHAPVNLESRVWYNSELKSKNFIVPGLIAVILQVIAALLTSLTIAREWELGNMELLLSTPVRPTELILGKMAAFFAIGAADTLIAVLLGHFAFGVPLRGSLGLLAISAFVFLFGSLCWGLLISALARTQILAYQIGLLTSFLPSFLLSDFIYPIENMPGVIQAVTYIVPSRYFIAMLKGIFLKALGLNLLWPQLLLLALYAAIVFVVASKRLDQKLVRS